MGINSPKTNHVCITDDPHKREGGRAGFTGICYTAGLDHEHHRQRQHTLRGGP